MVYATPDEGGGGGVDNSLGNRISHETLPKSAEMMVQIR